MFDLICGVPLSIDWMENSGLDFMQKFSRDMFLTVGLEYMNSDRFWDRVEPHRVASLKDKKEEFCEENRHHDVDIASHFDTVTPAADQYLLHFAPGWNCNRNPNPLILLHGAGLDATSYTDLFAMGFKGLQQQLVELGYRVFALTFSHSHGDNFIQAEQLADAIARVKELSGADQVDLLAHSKGGMAARIYLSNLSSTAYRGDVRRYVMLGTPNMGLDFPFRNPLFNFMVYIAGSNGVMAWDQIMSMGSMVDTSKRAVYKDGCFPGQCQMLYRWDGEYSLDMLQPDWWTTYFGGTGFVSHSRGIDAAIRDGGSLIEKMDKRGLEAGIEFSVLAGNNFIFNSFPGESSGPSDGVMFVESVLHTDGLQNRGAKLKAKEILFVNHMELLFARRVCRWVDKQLQD